MLSFLYFFLFWPVQAQDDSGDIYSAALDSINAGNPEEAFAKRFNILIAFPLLIIWMMLAGCSADLEQNQQAFSPAGWTAQPVETTARLHAVSIASDQVVWVSGWQGTYARTEDGGKTWETGVVPGADTLAFRDVYAVAADTAYLLSAGPGAASRIYKTVDGGARWTLQFQNEDPAGFLDCFDFWDAERGIAFSDAVDERVFLLQTEDGGATWSRIPPESVPAALPDEGGFAASGTCVVTGADGRAWVGIGASAHVARVLRTVDYGRSWSVAETPLPQDTETAGIYSLAFRDNLHGAALGGDFRAQDTTLRNVATTSDGGETWNLADPAPLRGAVWGASYVSETETPTLVAVGPDGSAYSADEGQTWIRIDSTSFWGVAFTSPTVGWAVGPDSVYRVARIAITD